MAGETGARCRMEPPVEVGGALLQLVPSGHEISDIARYCLARQSRRRGPLPLGSVSDYVRWDGGWLAFPC